MITDNALTFSTKQNVTATADSTNVIDLGGSTISGSTYGDPQNDSRMALFVDSVAAVPAANTSVVITLLTADDAAFTINSATLITSAAITTWGTGILAYIGVVPPGLRRYVKLTYTVTNNFTSSQITAGLIEVADLNSATQSVFAHD